MTAARMVDLLEHACPDLRVPRLDADVRAYIAAEVAAAGGATELGFVCRWDDATKSITSARLVWRGAKDQVPAAPDDLSLGELYLHNHPTTGPITPSKGDLDEAQRLAAVGIGFAIVDNEAERLYVVREPIVPRRLREPPTKVRTRVWSWWRFSIMYHSPAAGGVR